MKAANIFNSKHPVFLSKTAYLRIGFLTLFLFSNLSVKCCTQTTDRIMLEGLPIYNYPIVLVKVLETKIEPTRNVSKVLILETFFGTIDTNIISIISGGPPLNYVNSDYEIPRHVIPPNTILLVYANPNSKENFSLDTHVYIEYYDSSANFTTKLSAIRQFDAARKLKGKHAFEYYYPNTKLGAKGHFRNGKPVGKWQFFLENGKIKAVNYYDTKTSTIPRGIIYYYKSAYPDEYTHHDTLLMKIAHYNISKGKVFERDTTNFYMSQESMYYVKKNTSYSILKVYYPSGVLSDLDLDEVRNLDKPIKIYTHDYTAYYPSGKLKEKRYTVGSEVIFLEKYLESGEKIEVKK